MSDAPASPTDARGDDAPATAPVARWTGGQFSLVRIVLGVSLLAHFALHAAADPDGLGLALSLVGAAASAAVALGWRDQALGVVAWIALVALAVTGRLVGGHANGAFLVALVVHCASPPAPFLSWSARGRVDPGGGWGHSPRAAHLAWSLLVLLTMLQVGQGLLMDGVPLTTPWALMHAALGLALVLACWPRARPLGWTAMLVLQLALAILVGGAGLPLGFVALLLFVFDPAWVPPRRRAGEPPATVFYDGHCGLCHRTVRLLMAEDVDGDVFRFAPLQGPTFAQTVPEAERAELPDSVIVRTPDGRLHMRSAAALEALLRLGGLWRVLGAALAIIPAPLRDLGYDTVARVRKRIFGEPEAACPIIPPELGARFLP